MPNYDAEIELSSAISRIKDELMRLREDVKKLKSQISAIEELLQKEK